MKNPQEKLSANEKLEELIDRLLANSILLTNIKHFQSRFLK
jgi:hypothetical protein